MSSRAGRAFPPCTTSCPRFLLTSSFGFLPACKAQLLSSWGPSHLSPPHVLNAMLLSGTGAGPLTFSWPTLACALSSNRNFSYSPSVCGSAPCSIAFCNPCILLDFSRSTFQGTSHSTSSTSLSFPQSKFLLQGKKESLCPFTSLRRSHPPSCLTTPSLGPVLTVPSSPSSCGSLIAGT